jgi:multiple sugar transport system permease protein
MKLNYRAGLPPKVTKILSKIFVYFLLLIISIITFFPFFWMLSTSFKVSTEAYEVPPTWIPRQFTFENYLEHFREVGSQLYASFPVFYKNGLIVAGCSSVLVMLLSILAAYSFSRYKFFGKNGMLIFLIFTQMFPWAIIIVNLVILFNKLHLLNTYPGLILAITALTLPFTIWILKGFFDRIPRELEEAAMVDGCSRINILFKILLPTVMPGVISVGVIAFLNSWNNLLFAIQIAYKNNMYTLPPGFIQMYVGQYNILWTNMCAGSAMATIPVIIIFMFLQKFFIQGLTSGAVKG